MTAKDQVVKFLTLIFIIILISFFIIFFTVGNRFVIFTELIKSLMPVAVFVLLLLVKYKLEKSEIKRRSEEGILEITLYLHFSDKLLFDMLGYLVPIGILLIALLLNGTVTFLDIIQALFVFVILYVWNHYLFTRDKG